MRDKAKSGQTRPRKITSLAVALLAACWLWLCLGLLLGFGNAHGLEGEIDGYTPSASNQLLNNTNLSLDLHGYFQPPDNGQKHRILVIDQHLWGFIEAAGRSPRRILNQTPYALSPKDWAIWGRPLQTEFADFYVLLIVRYEENARSHGQTTPPPQPAAKPADRSDETTRVNRLVHRQLTADDYDGMAGWNVYAEPKHLLQNVIVVNPPAVIYQPSIEIANGLTAVLDPGAVGLVREFRVLTEIDGIPVDNQAVASWAISYTQTKTVAIGIKYDKGYTVPEWQRPILAKMAGIDSSDWEYADYIVYRESRWKPRAKNQSSGAYGLCQSLPAKKMRSVDDDYRENALTQLRWCHGYAQERYGSWEQAYYFWVENHWW